MEKQPFLKMYLLVNMPWEPTTFVFGGYNIFRAFFTLILRVPCHLAFPKHQESPLSGIGLYTTSWWNLTSKTAWSENASYHLLPTCRNPCSSCGGFGYSSTLKLWTSHGLNIRKKKLNCSWYLVSRTWCLQCREDMNQYLRTAYPVLPPTICFDVFLPL